MGFLNGKKILLTGLLSSRSIAYGIGKALQREGATLAFTYAGAPMRERVEKLVTDFGGGLTMSCDVSKDEEIASTFESIKREWGELDGVVHAIGFAPREAISGSFLDGLSRQAFLTAHDISAYSFAAMAKAAAPLMVNRGEGKSGALLTLSYLGAVRAVPNYNTMGVAKASLEATVRYLATGMGPMGVRVNGISAGPIKTLAAAGIAGFGKMLKHVADAAPLKRNVTIDEVGNVAAFLMSDLASAITGEITYVDCGYSIVAAGMDDGGEKPPA
jgi:enoyl-[acyl-carrier protein] reductase I